jgi:hypothetical protein
MKAIVCLTNAIETLVYPEFKSCMYKFQSDDYHFNTKVIYFGILN